MIHDRFFKTDTRLPGFRSPFELASVLTILTVIPLLIVRPFLAILPLVIFSLLCLAGSFIQRFSFFLPIIRKGERNQAAVSLTFDDGPDPKTTPLLLALLARYGVKGTFFLIGEKVATHPDLIREILAEGHEIGNHSDTHDVFLMLRGKQQIAMDISRCQARLADFSARPWAFRPPVGVTNPHLRTILESQNMLCIGFSCRPLDFGNRRIKNLKDKVLENIRPGDIMLLHDCKPSGRATVDQWLEQVEGILLGLQKKHLQTVPLADLIGRPRLSASGGRMLNR